MIEITSCRHADRLLRWKADAIHQGEGGVLHGTGFGVWRWDAERDALRHLKRQLRARAIEKNPNCQTRHIDDGDL